MGSIPAEADVAVVGSGAAGMAAAVTLAEGGAKVVVFEKQRSLGGTTNFLHGTFAVESDMQRERFIEISRATRRSRAPWTTVTGGRIPRLVRAIVNESGSTIRWLQDQGRGVHRRHHQHARSPADVSRRQGQGRGHRQGLVTEAKEQRGRRPAGRAGHRAAEGGRPDLRSAGRRRRRGESRWRARP